ncbi:MAG: HD-GYP domain-containing protein [Gammaproteobacteria bacterium]|nr:HD-GYP domain-containing protein [Gammaproteobacteria bacterium]
MKIQLPVEKLEKGMYVAELDRPWEGTPFLFQGFTIEGEDDLAALRQQCQHVFVDDLKSSAEQALQDRLHTAVRGSAITVVFTEWEGAKKLRDTLKRIERKRDDVVTSLARLADSTLIEQDEQLQQTRGAVVQLIDDIAADPKTSLWMRILSEQDATIGRHAVNTSTLAVAFAAELGWDKELQSVVGEGAMLHDVGMARVPEKVRNKPGSLTAEEYRLVKLHPGYAAKRLEGGSKIDARILDIVRHHHERLDGSGYPDGLADGDIAPYVQLVSICDVYDTYTTVQPYRKQLTPSATMRRLTQRAGTQFDKELVEKFIRFIGIYPLGSLARLRNGGLAIIVASDEKRRLHPTVLLVKDADGKALRPRRTLNLAFIESGGLSDKYGITELIEPASVQIDVRDVLLQELQLR